MKCPNCDHVWQETRTDQAPQSLRRPPAGWRDTLHTLGNHPSCKKEWGGFLADMTGKDRVSEKQWKFYAVIHKECLGTWPAQYFDKLEVYDGSFRPQTAARATAMGREFAKALGGTVEKVTVDDFEVPF